ncbi:MAG: hypothetical protein ACPLQP_04850 [Moorellaceae bacterium]
MSCPVPGYAPDILRILKHGADKKGFTSTTGLQNLLTGREILWEMPRFIVMDILEKA